MSVGGLLCLAEEKKSGGTARLDRKEDLTVNTSVEVMHSQIKGGDLK